MNNRFNTRRSGTERDRYEADRGNARSDRERYELSDRDESGYRGWTGEGSRDGEYRTSSDDFSRNESEDDRDRWTTSMGREGWRDENRGGALGREQMRQGRGGYGLTSSSNRNEMGHWDRNPERNQEQGQRAFRPSSDFRGQGYGGVVGYEGREFQGREYQGQYGYGGGTQAGGGQFGHRGYGGSMGGGSFGQGHVGGYGQRNMSYGGMGGSGMQNPGVYGGRGFEGGQQGGQYGQSQYGQGQSVQYGQGQGQFGPYGQNAFSQQQQQMQQMQRRIARGPKGYKRSDERIKEDVCDQLAHCDDLDPSEIEVSVTNADVTLSGTIPERHMKYMAEQIAERVSGVNEIHNQMRVKRADQQEQQAGQQSPTQGTQQQSGSLPLPRDMQLSNVGAENGRRGGMRS